MRKGFSWMLLASCVASLHADTVALKNGDRLTGAIQKLENGKLSLKSAYSESSLQIDWRQVDTVTSETEFQVTLLDGRQATCSPSSMPIADIAAISLMPAEEALKSWLKEAWENSSVSADFDQNYSGLAGYNQLSSNTEIEYTGTRWDWSTQLHYFYYGATDSAKSTYQAYGRLVAQRYINGDHLFLFPYLFLGRQTTADGGAGQIRQYGGGVGWTFGRGASHPVSILAGIVRNVASGFALAETPDGGAIRTDAHFSNPLYVVGADLKKTLKSKTELTLKLFTFKPVLESGRYAMATDSSIKVPLFGKTYFTVRAYDTPELGQKRLFSTKNLQVSSGIGVEF